MAHTIDSVLEESKREVREKHKGDNMKYVYGALELSVIISVLIMGWVIITGEHDLIIKIVAVPAVVWALCRLVIQFSK